MKAIGICAVISIIWLLLYFKIIKVVRGKRGMKGRKSYVLTIIIYGLIIYIIFNFINMGTKNIFSDSMLENIVSGLHNKNG